MSSDSMEEKRRVPHSPVSHVSAMFSLLFPEFWLGVSSDPITMFACHANAGFSSDFQEGNGAGR